MSVIYRAFPGQGHAADVDGVSLEIAGFLAASAELAKSAHLFSRGIDDLEVQLRQIDDAAQSDMHTVLANSRSDLRFALQSITEQMRQFAKIFERGD